jgi:hypothetical protein
VKTPHKNHPRDYCKKFKFASYIASSAVLTKLNANGIVSRQKLRCPTVGANLAALGFDVGADLAALGFLDSAVAASRLRALWERGQVGAYWVVRSSLHQRPKPRRR